MGHYAENGIIENPIGTLNKKDYKLKRPEKGYNLLQQKGNGQRGLMFQIGNFFSKAN